ncbi:TIGR01777 family oxidoreductase [Ammoniphilus sp. CFH 90114]|uniref:TIGR01777 family oxidoreductase n=1 Tax=Ammoniphilus sp. CFH 90114 TaxID=2493665 RepID=UPI00100F95B2|nr:TIGR01777 family oxidoreductase [Ammoniphilus sp. CFH 90114]RXT04135.1 TIGR01777 family protein [Ammoniphilus sp. CFH 90114]
MLIAILGGTGFIGSHLVRGCIDKGYKVILLTRQPDKYQSTDHVTYLKWPLQEGDPCLEVDATINLAGETINQRWNSRAKSAILNSRVQTIQMLVKLMEQGKIKSSVVINGSAVGYYGHSDEALFTEKDRPKPQADDFLAQVVHAWEKEADQVAKLGIRLVKARIGVVLGREGGALPKMALPYQLFAGGRIGGGQQYLSWIHIKDIVGLMLYCIESRNIEGAVNFTAPQPVRMASFGQTLASVLNRPHWLPTPAFVFRLAFGEMSDLLLKGQQVIPQKALDSGYSYNFPDLKQALQNIFSR